MHGITFSFMHTSCLVHGLFSARFGLVSGVLFQGWDVGTMGNTHTGCVTHVYPRVDASEASAIHPIHTNVRVG